MLNSDVNRRDFLKIAAGAGAAFAVPGSTHAAVSSSRMIGIQVGAISFVDEGTEKVLDLLQERACVNTLFLAVFTYGRGIAGRQIPGQPLGTSPRLIPSTTRIRSSSALTLPTTAIWISWPRFYPPRKSAA